MQGFAAAGCDPDPPSILDCFLNVRRFPSRRNGVELHLPGIRSPFGRAFQLVLP